MTYTWLTYEASKTPALQSRRAIISLEEVVMTHMWLTLICTFDINFWILIRI